MSHRPAHDRILQYTTKMYNVREDNFGSLTSLQTLDLVLFIEAEFGIVIPGDQVTEDSFTTIDAVVAAMEAVK